MSNDADNRVSREDFANALREMGTFVDVTLDDLLELNTRAEKYARLRVAESGEVERVMSRNVITVKKDCSLADAAHLLVTHRISGLPVVDDDNRLVGVVTEADLLRAMGLPAHHPTHSLWQTLESMFAHPVQIPEPTGRVADLMVEHVITVGPHETLQSVLEIMKKNRIKRVIVCDEQRHVVGMVTRSDLVRVFFDKLRRPGGR